MLITWFPLSRLSRKLRACVHNFLGLFICVHCNSPRNWGRCGFIYSHKVCSCLSKVIWSDARELGDLGMVVLVKELKSLQKSSKASSTLSKYASRWKTWCAWSSSTLHIPEIPAKPLYVALFLTEMFLSCVGGYEGRRILGPRVSCLCY